jgi:hypothetical protein
MPRLYDLFQQQTKSLFKIITTQSICALLAFLVAFDRDPSHEQTTSRNKTAVGLAIGWLAILRERRSWAWMGLGPRGLGVGYRETRLRYRMDCVRLLLLLVGSCWLAGLGDG